MSVADCVLLPIVITMLLLCISSASHGRIRVHYNEHGMSADQLDKAMRWVSDCREPMPKGVDFYVEVSNDGGSTWYPYVKLRQTADDTSRVFAAKSFVVNEVVCLHIGDPLFTDPKGIPRDFKYDPMEAFMQGLGYTRDENLGDMVVRNKDAVLHVIDGGYKTGFVGMGVHLARTDQEDSNLYAIDNGLYVATRAIHIGDEIIKAN